MQSGQKNCYGSAGGVSWLGDLMRGAEAFSSVGEPELVSLSNQYVVEADFETENDYWCRKNDGE